MVVTARGLRFLGRTFPCTIGRTGLTGDKREGDGATPQGVHAITGCLYRPDPLYDLVLTTGWNWPRAERGRGSAIFIHRWRKPGHPTAGCVALDPAHLLWIAARIRHRTRLVVP